MLENGDVIRVTNGMKVNTSVPEKFVYGNRRFSEKITKSIIIVGKLLKLTEQDIKERKESLLNRVMSAFSYEGYDIEKKYVNTFINEMLSTDMLIKEDEFIFDEGEFVVTEIKRDGGGTGHGPNDVYPNGHHVFAKRLAKDGSFDPDGDEVDFYQSGSFTHTYDGNIPVIRKMKITVTYT